MRPSTQLCLSLAFGLALPALAAQPYTLISHRPDGAPADGQSFYARSDATGDSVVFHSDSTDLVAGDDAYMDLYLWDRATDTVWMVNRNVVSGAHAMSQATPEDDVSISGNGRFVAHRSSFPAVIVPGYPEGCEELLIYDRDADGDGVFDEPGAVTNSVLSIRSDGERYTLENVSYWCGTTYAPALSHTGRFVAFRSSRELVDTSGFHVTAGGRFYWMDRDADEDGLFDEPDGIEIRALTPPLHNPSSYGEHDSPMISADGLVVVFTTRADNIVAGDSDLYPDSFVYDAETNQLARLDIGISGAKPNKGVEAQSISGDGRSILLYTWSTNLGLPTGQGVERQLLVYDRVDGMKRLISKRNDETPIDAGHLSYWNNPMITGDGLAIYHRVEGLPPTLYPQGNACLTWSWSSYFEFDLVLDQARRYCPGAASVRNGESVGDQILEDVTDVDGPQVVRRYPTESEREGLSGNVGMQLYLFDVEDVEPGLGMSVPNAQRYLSQELVYDFVIDNPSSSAATMPIVAGEIPANTVFLGATIQYGSCELVGDDVVCTSEGVGPYSTTTGQVRLRATAVGDFTLGLGVGVEQVDAVPGDETDSVQVHVDADADLRLIINSMTTTSDPDERKFAITISNLTALAVPSVQVFSASYSGQGIASVTGTIGNGQCQAAAGVLSCTGIDLAANGTASGNLVVVLDKAGSYYGSLQVDGPWPDPVYSNDGYYINYSQKIDLGITATMPTGKKKKGGTLLVPFTVTNHSDTGSMATAIYTTQMIRLKPLSATFNGVSCNVSPTYVSCPVQLAPRATLSGVLALKATKTGMATVGLVVDTHSFDLDNANNGVVLTKKIVN